MNTRFFVLALIVIVLAVSAVLTSNNNTEAHAEALVNFNVPNPCYKWNDVSPFSVIDDRRIRQAHCEPVGDIQPSVVEIAPVVETTPVCTNLFLSAGSIVVGTQTNGGGIVTEVKGNWVVELNGRVLMAEGGKSFVVTFPEDVVIQQIALYDNDPKIGEIGWSINGVALPETGSNTWLAVLDFNLVTSQLTFDKGNDSAHIAICIL